MSYQEKGECEGGWLTDDMGLREVHTLLLTKVLHLKTNLDKFDISRLSRRSLHTTSQYSSKFPEPQSENPDAIGKNDNYGLRKESPSTKKCALPKPKVAVVLAAISLFMCRKIPFHTTKIKIRPSSIDHTPWKHKHLSP